MLTIDTTDIFFDKNVTRTLHQDGNLNVPIEKKKNNWKMSSKFCDSMLLLFEINEECCINKGLSCFVYVLGTYM